MTNCSHQHFVCNEGSINLTMKILLASQISKYTSCKIDKMPVKWTCKALKKFLIRADSSLMNGTNCLFRKIQQYCKQCDYFKRTMCLHHNTKVNYRQGEREWERERAQFVTICFRIIQVGYSFYFVNSIFIFEFSLYILFVM